MARILLLIAALAAWAFLFAILFVAVRADGTTGDYSALWVVIAPEQCDAGMCITRDADTEPEPDAVVDEAGIFRIRDCRGQMLAVGTWAFGQHPYWLAPEPQLYATLAPDVRAWALGIVGFVHAMDSHSGDMPVPVVPSLACAVS